MASAPEQTFEVVLWRSSGDAIARPPALQRVPLTLSDELALPTFLSEVSARSGLGVALLRLHDGIAHVELVESEGPVVEWQAPDLVVGGCNPWNALGWYTETASVIDCHLRTTGAQRRGPLVQRKHWSISAILSAETDQGRFWFKQVPPFMAQEGPLISWLARLRPDAVPEVVSVGDDWFLTREFTPAGGDSSPSGAFGLLAELQQLSASRASDLLSLGCPDRRQTQLRVDLEALCGREDLLDEERRSTLLRLVPVLGERLDELQSGGVPETVVHGDLHSGNWRAAADGGLVIFDWTDACLAHPFMDLGVLPLEDSPARRARIDGYLGKWRSVVDGDLEALVDVALPVAAAHHAVSYQRIVDNVDASDAEDWLPTLRGYLDRMFHLLADAR